MPKANNTTQPKHWYKQSSTWGWIVAGASILALIIIMAADEAAERKAKANRQPLRPWSEVLTTEEAELYGIKEKIDGPGDWKPDPNAAKNFRELIEKGGNADPNIDGLNNVDFYDIIDQMGGEEGF